MPGLEFFSKRSEPEARQSAISVDVEANGNSHVNGFSQSIDTPSPQDPDVYYNARLDPKNFLDGPLSWNPSTRLRQMLARPGIVVAPGICDGISARCALEAGFDCLYQRYRSRSFIFEMLRLTDDAILVARLLQPPALVNLTWRLPPSTTSSNLHKWCAAWTHKCLSSLTPTLG